MKFNKVKLISSILKLKDVKIKISNVVTFLQSYDPNNDGEITFTELFIKIIENIFKV